MGKLGLRRRFEVIPSLLESEIEEVEEKVARLPAGSHRLHLDIIDGTYADDITITPADLQQIDLTRFGFELHLMVDDPMAWVEESVAIGPTGLIAQIERMGEQGIFVKWVKGYGVSAGLALDLDTPIDAIEMDLFDDLNVVLLMSVRAGRSGQEFDERVIGKVSELRRNYRGKIAVDGGMNPSTARSVLAAGADEVVVNSYLWQSDQEPEVQMERFYE